MKSYDKGIRRAAFGACALAALSVLAACTGGGSGAGDAASIPVAPMRMSAEVITGSGIATGPSVTVRASGDFTDEGTLNLPIGNPRTFVFRFGRGDLVVLNATGPTSGPLNLNRTTCSFSQALNGTFRVLSGNSTGTYAGATGHGSYVFSSTGSVPRTASGLCDAEKAVPARDLGVVLHGSLLLNLGS